MHTNEDLELQARIIELEEKNQELKAEITKYKPYYDAIVWLQEYHGEASHWTNWCVETDDYERYSDDFLDAFENLKNLVEGENNG